ncbi:hypothetical protein KR084_000948 [Drosophila pseudotakahashii]|nr:hypothetical protein KR084_000948 [Drosophila pseudotakahashii]
MPRRVLENYGFEPAKQSCLRKLLQLFGLVNTYNACMPCTGKSKLDPKGKCGVAVKKQPREQPVEEKNPLQFLEQKTDAELVVHWTRAAGRTFPPIKLLPPW